VLAELSLDQEIYRSLFENARAYPPRLVNAPPFDDHTIYLLPQLFGAGDMHSVSNRDGSHGT
jgi:hypothetical protein